MKWMAPLDDALPRVDVLVDHDATALDIDPSCTHLRIRNGRLRTLAGIEQLAQLQDVRLIDMQNLDLDRACELLAELPELVKLSLEGRWVRRLPDMIDRMPSLFELWLCDSPELAWGEALEHVAHISTLRILRLYQRDPLTLPDAFAQLAQIRELELGFQLTALPPSIADMPALERLDASRNRITWEVPLAFTKHRWKQFAMPAGADLPQALVVTPDPPDRDELSFTGNVPQQFGDPQSLEIVDREGEVPQLARLTRLRRLALRNTLAEYALPFITAPLELFQIEGTETSLPALPSTLRAARLWTPLATIPHELATMPRLTNLHVWTASPDLSTIEACAHLTNLVVRASIVDHLDLSATQIARAELWLDELRRFSPPSTLRVLYVNGPLDVIAPAVAQQPLAYFELFARVTDLPDELGLLAGVEWIRASWAQVDYVPNLRNCVALRRLDLRSTSRIDDTLVRKCLPSGAWTYADNGTYKTWTRGL
ncbi:MAG: hypothetical protein QM831_17385 [Kofleriaceae bacterium]